MATALLLLNDVGVLPHCIRFSLERRINFKTLRSGALPREPISPPVSSKQQTMKKFRRLFQEITLGKSLCSLLNSELR